MAGFKYEAEELSLEIGDKKYPFREPSHIEQSSLKAKFESASPENAFNIYIDFFVGLGLPKEPLDKMSVRGLIGLFEYAVGAKKN